jgi:hypothetical protein
MAKEKIAEIKLQIPAGPFVFVMSSEVETSLISN